MFILKIGNYLQVVFPAESTSMVLFETEEW